MKQQVGESFNKEPMSIRQRWHEWAFKHDYPPMPNIGTMIEFLSQYQRIKINHDESLGNHLYWVEFEYNDASGACGKYLCDALWEACKEVLDK
jgi:hypothetical protein